MVFRVVLRQPRATAFPKASFIGPNGSPLEGICDVKVTDHNQSYSVHSLGGKKKCKLALDAFKSSSASGHLFSIVGHLCYVLSMLTA